MKQLTQLCRRHKALLWGQPHFVTPRLVNWIHGDGLQVIYLAPLATRPNYYLARIDSKIDLCNRAPTAVCFADQVLDTLYDQIEDQFGRALDEWEGDDGRAHSKLWPFPALDDSCGSSWGKVEVLKRGDARTNRKVQQDVERVRAAERR